MGLRPCGSWSFLCFFPKGMQKAGRRSARRQVCQVGQSVSQSVGAQCAHVFFRQVRYRLDSQTGLAARLH